MQFANPPFRFGLKAALAVELILLCLAAPLVYLPEHFPSWTLGLALALAASTWLWRRWCLQKWIQRSPVEWPLFFLFGVMLPVAVAVAPTPLRELYSIPKALVLVWNFCLFWTIVTYSSQNLEMYQLCVSGFCLGGVAVAILALLGTQWQNKMFGLDVLLYQLPRPLEKVFKGASDGFNPNQVAGTLLYLLPLQIWLCVDEGWRRRRWLILGASLAALFLTGIVFTVAQSRGALLGLAASLLLMGLLPYRWGRWLLIALVALMLFTLPFVPVADWLARADQSTTMQTTTGISSFAGRQEIWTRALYGIQDFPFTGMGLGTFRQLMHQLYPTILLPNDVDFAHAHNFFLQTALDFGLPGLIAVLAIYLLAIVLLLTTALGAPLPASRIYALGLLGAVVAQTIFSMMDAVALGSKTNFMFWYLFALIFGLAGLTENKGTVASLPTAWAKRGDSSSESPENRTIPATG